MNAIQPIRGQESLYKLYKTSYCTSFGSASVQKLITVALSVHITLECYKFPKQSSDVCSKLLQLSVIDFLSLQMIFLCELDSGKQ